MRASVLSVNVGESGPPLGKQATTGIRKQPVEFADVRAPGPKHGGLGSGLVGDHTGDRTHHGGDAQAVYTVAREELDGWEQRLGLELPSGWFGENLTTRDLDVDGALLGERWRVGDDVVLRVAGPRVPCATFAARMGLPGWLRTFTQHGRTGAYLSVVAPGRIAPGDSVAVDERPDHGIDVMTAFRAWTGDAAAARRALDAGVMADQTEHLEGVVARTSRA